MRLKSEAELDHHLQTGLPPILLIHSDVPLLREEACSRVRAAFTMDPGSERQSFWVDDQLDYEHVYQEIHSLSLFAPRRLIELHFGGSTPSSEGARWLREYAAAPVAETSLLVTSGYVNQRARRQRWFQAVEQVGVTLALFPPDRTQLGSWLERRLRGRNLELTPEALKSLVERVEGNLEAAHQEVEKLALYTEQDGGPLGIGEVLEAVGDHAHYSAFDLTEAALQGEAERVVRILAVLRSENTRPSLLITILAREVRNLILLGACLREGGAVDEICRELQIFPPRKRVLLQRARTFSEEEAQQLLRRLAYADRLAKGIGVGDAWAVCEQVALELAEVTADHPLWVTGEGVGEY